MALVVNSMLANVLLLEFKFTVRCDSSFDNELTVHIFSTTRDLFTFNFEWSKFHLLMVAILNVVTSPFTLLVQEKVSSHALDWPLATDGLAFFFPVIVNLMCTLILLHKLYIHFLSIKSDELELTNLILSSSLNLVALHFELFKSHLVLLATLLIPALPDAHFIVSFWNILYSRKISQKCNDL